MPSAIRPLSGKLDTVLLRSLKRPGHGCPYSLACPPRASTYIALNLHERLVRRLDAGRTDKPATVRPERVGRQIVYLEDKDIARLNIVLAFVLGLAV